MALRAHHRLAILTGIVATAASAGSCTRPRPAGPNAAVLGDFAKRVNAYVSLRNKLAESVGELDPTSSQAVIARRATGLGTAIVRARANARRGDIFTPQVTALLARIMREEHARRSAPVKETREDQQDELPNFVPQVNRMYPTTYPLATFPPALLPLLPRIPKEVEYRIVRDYLILRDVEANLIIDYMPGAEAGGR